MFDSCCLGVKRAGADRAGAGLAAILLGVDNDDDGAEGGGGGGLAPAPLAYGDGGGGARNFRTLYPPLFGVAFRTVFRPPPLCAF